MKIIALKIDGYGVWTGLKVDKFSDGLNVLYGPNEAGKTTLLQFIRSMLYGFSDSRRQYFPPVFGGKPGGMADVESPQGRYEIARYWQPEFGGEQVMLTASDGTRQGEHLVKAMLTGVDETIFNNVFAVELREMQELGALGDTAAAELLYNLTAGLDRISLVEVLRELEISRNRLLDAEGKPCILVNLHAEREKLLGAIGELGGLTRRYAHLSGERSQLDTELARLEEERNGVERQAKTVELAVLLRDRWAERAAIDVQLAELGPTSPLPEKLLARLDALNAKLDRRRQLIAELRTEREQIRGEASGIQINETLVRQFARIEALQEQEPWLLGVEDQIRSLDAEIARLEGEFAGERKRLGLNDNAELPLENLSPRTFAPLRSPAKNLRRTRENLERARSEAESAQKASETLAKEVAAALSARNESNLNEAMDKAGQTVSLYRRRLQIDERLDQLARHLNELDEQHRQATERQLLSGAVLFGLGTMFVLCVLLVLTGLVLLPLFSTGVNYITAILGFVGLVGTYFGKIALEKANANRLESCRKQLALVQGQIKQLKEEREELDARLPRGGGPLVSRLESAEKDLAALEEMVPKETRRSSAAQTADAARQNAAQAEEEYKAARRKWRESLSAAGLPEDFSSKQVRHLANRFAAMSENRRLLSQRNEELDRRRKERESIAARMTQIAADAGIELPLGEPIEQLKCLAAALAQQQAAAARRDVLHDQLKQLRQKRARNEEAVGRLNHRRRSLFFEAGAEDEESFRQKAAGAARAESLRSERQSLSNDIAAAIGNRCSEEAIGELLEGNRAAELESRGKLLGDRLAVLESQVRDRLEKRGQLAAQMQALADDRQLPRLQMDLGAVEGRIAESLKRWRVLAVTCRLLENIRTSYEREKQPETLKEASLYLARMTQGRYCRVWTPLGERTLRVDDAEGHSLPVESLSRGTREQLFLSLRLAIAASYARRGAALPMVLDDVLVNFDADRAAATAEVLKEFAAHGHQLLVFTCHEHIERIFAHLNVPLDRLPSATQRGGAVISFRRPAVSQEPVQEKVRTAARRKPAAKIKIIEEEIAAPIEETLEEEPESPPVSPALPMPPPARPASKKRLPKPQKAAKSRAVFDVDFFDRDMKEETDEEADEITENLEEIEDNDSLWPEDDSAEEESDEFEETGNGEM